MAGVSRAADVSARTTTQKSPEPQAPKPKAQQPHATNSREAGYSKKDSFEAASPKKAPSPSAAGAAAKSPPARDEGRPQDAATGKEAAARLKAKDTYFGAAGRDSRTQDFTDVIRKHQNNPAFVKELYANLGAKDSKELFAAASAQVANDQKGLYKTDAAQTEALKALARSTNQLPRSVSQELARDAARSSTPDTLVSVLKQPEASAAARRAFLDEAAKTADKSHVAAQKFGDVLSSNRTLLKEYVDKLGPDKFNAILQKGLSQPPLNGSFSARAPTKMDGLSKVFGEIRDLKGHRYDAFKTKVFADTAATLGKTPVGDARWAPLREDLTKLFVSNRDTLLKGLQEANGKLSVTGQKALSTFFSRTLFSNPAVPSKDALGKSVAAKLGDLMGPLNKHANTKDGQLPASVKRDARLLGSLVGTLEGGFHVAAENLKKENEAIDGATDFFASSVKEFIPALPIPGVGHLKDVAFDGIKKWVKDGLHEAQKKPNEAIPFHSAFGSLIANPDLATDYDATRAEAFLNRQQGLG
ncbi:hypothetical protein [Corallococcus exercitus]|uniref:hypothetical protein n=1 Tax=Corallococcus exercitus TaxID=2316736 RepID=UPI0035D4A374